jgi:hypothetical protein
MNIKEVAELTRVPAKTIRFYEDIGLIRPGRADNGHRRFSDRELPSASRPRTAGRCCRSGNRVVHSLQRFGAEPASWANS